MGAQPVIIIFCIVVAAAVTAALIYGYVPSREAFVFRRMMAWLRIKRMVATCRHAFDPDARRLDRYSRVMVDLQTALEFRNGIESRVAEALGPQGSAAARDLEEYKIIDRNLTGARERATRYLAKMSDEDIATVARFYQSGILEGIVHRDLVEQFFRDERALVGSMPHMATGHFDRMEHRFNGLYTSAAGAIQ